MPRRSVTVDDSDAFTRAKDDRISIHIHLQCSVECAYHEGNYTITGILRSARKADETAPKKADQD